MKKAIILGAGPVGLINAWLLLKNNWQVEVYEKNKIVGGMCRSWKWDSHIVDTGPHIFHTSNKQLWNFWQKNFGKLLVKGKYYSKNVVNSDFKNYHNYPLSIEGINLLGKELSKKIKNEIKLENKKISKNFKEHVINQVGPTLQKMFFNEYPEKVWGISVEEMTSDWAPKRIKFTKNISPFFVNEYTAVGKYGTGSIYEKIKKEIIKLGGKIKLNHEITNLDFENNDIKKIHFKGKYSKIVPEESIIISSLPLPLTARFLGHKSNLKFRGIRSIYVSLNKDKIFPQNTHWIYFGSKKIIFNRVSEPKLMSKFVSPKNKTYLCAEITYSKNDQIDKMSFDQIKKRVKDDLIKTDLIKKSDIISFSENKEDFVYPVQFIDYKYELSKTKYVVNKFNKLFSLGTGGDFDYSDSQIIFLKCFDFVNTLENRYSKENQMIKSNYSIKLNKRVKIGNTLVGKDCKPFIIAEVGLNHNGDVKLAKELILQAKLVGCDAVKFQTFTANSRVSKNYRSANFAEKADGLQEDIHEMFERLSLNPKQNKEIFQYAKKNKIEIFSTPFSISDVEQLEKLKVKFYKTASVDLVNLELIERIGKTGKPLILSTGMSNLINIEEAINKFKSTGNKNLILLHCLSSYPANESEMNLNAIKLLKKIYNIPVGLSDHYPNLNVSKLALGLGANIIERHFTIDKRLEGPDHILSSTPEEFTDLNSLARNVNNILGTGEKIIQPSEFQVINTQRKSIYANKNLKKGEKILKNSIIVKGPAGGLAPKYLDLIIGKKIIKNIPKDYPVTWDHLLKN